MSFWHSGDVKRALSVSVPPPPPPRRSFKRVPFMGVQSLRLKRKRFRRTAKVKLHPPPYGPLKHSVRSSVRRLFVTCGVFARCFSVAFTWLFRGPLLSRVGWCPSTVRLVFPMLVFQLSKQQNRTRTTFSTVLGTPPNRTRTKTFPLEEL